MPRPVPLVNGRVVDDIVAEGKRRLTQLTLLPDDPQDPECDWRTLALCLALRGALRGALETLELYGEDFLEESPAVSRSFYAGRLSQARQTILRITEALDDLPQGPRPPRGEEDEE